MKKRPKKLELSTETLHGLDRGLMMAAADDYMPTPPRFTCGWPPPESRDCPPTNTVSRLNLCVDPS